MNGLEKIIQKIEEDSKLQADSIISKAAEDVSEILKKAEADAIKEAEFIIEEAKKKCSASVSAARSSAQMNEKKAMLKAKNEAINEAINKALESLKNLDDGEYFEIIKALVIKYSDKGEGIVKFSETDLKRLPKGFEKELNKALKAKDATVKISEDAVAIDGGCIIVYGDIEENCTFEALVQTSLDDIKDALYNIIF